MEPLLAYFGHHKCGSSWIRSVVADACCAAGLTIAVHPYERHFDEDIIALRQKQQFDFWCYINADVNYTRGLNVRGFHVVRDPRDIIASAYFSHLYSHPDHDWPRLRYYRPYLRNLSKRDGLLAEMEFNAIFLSQMLMWDYSRPEILELRFEDMILEDYEAFDKVFKFLGLIPTALVGQQVTTIVEKHSFRNLSGGRDRGREDPLSHYRKGEPGDWRNHFEPVHIDYFKKLYNPLLIKLRYEMQDDWQ